MYVPSLRCVIPNVRLIPKSSFPVPVNFEGSVDLFDVADWTILLSTCIPNFWTSSFNRLPPKASINTVPDTYSGVEALKVISYAFVALFVFSSTYTTCLISGSSTNVRLSP